MGRDAFTGVVSLWVLIISGLALIWRRLVYS